MSWSDGTIWRCRLEGYVSRAERLPIIKVTEKRVYLERWSGQMLRPDDRVANIDKRTVIPLDREALRLNGLSRTRPILYDQSRRRSAVNPDPYGGPDRVEG